MGRCERPPARRVVATTAVIAAVVLAWPWLSIGAQAAAGTVWWAASPQLRWAPEPSKARQGNSSVPVPKILHQTWKTADVPARWAAARQACLDLHPDFEHRLWTDADGLAFIKEHFPWFLPTYLGYPYDIQRVDTLRYFILLHHGGVYLDLDIECRTRLDFMLTAPLTAPLTNPVGISNDALAAVPGTPFLEHAVRRLPDWNRWMGFQYAQVMFSTGPMFLSVQYSLAPSTLRRTVAVIPRLVYGKYQVTPAAAFGHLHGSSWHAGDAPLIFWLDRHKVVLTLAGASLAVVIASLAVGRCLSRRADYRPLKLME